jgi:RNA polymerase sigma factor (sigma-70 family)
MSQPMDQRRQWVLAALDEYERRLVRYARRLTGDDSSARDAVQHTFVRLWEQPRESLNGRLAPWLFSVCRNRALDLLRARRRTESLDRPDAPPPIGAEPDPAQAAELGDLAERLRRRIARLPAAQGEAIGLWAEGFTYREIAQVLKTREGNVRVLVHRGLSTLRNDPVTRQLLGE